MSYYPGFNRVCQKCCILYFFKQVVEGGAIATNTINSTLQHRSLYFLIHMFTPVPAFSSSNIVRIGYIVSI
jgi:hypothetical protein